MIKNIRLRQLFLLISDVTILYVSLIITFLIRYGLNFWDILIEYNIGPFSLVFIIWIAIFYISGLYELKRLKNNLEFRKTLFISILSAGLITIIIFYVIPFFGITPKTNLILFVIIFGFLSYILRSILNNRLSNASPSIKLLLIGNDDKYEEILKQIEKNPQIGYKLNYWIEDESSKDIENLNKIIVETSSNAIVLPSNFKEENRLIKTIFNNINPDLEIINVLSLYEIIFQKIPLSSIEESWFIENISKGKKNFYQFVNQITEIIFILIFGIISLPISLIISILIKITSPDGSIIYRQERIGKNGNKFILYKFRTMIPVAEKNGPQWAQEDDPRITNIGKILRYSHLDEIPQIINIIKGDLALVGPRPERPEFVSQLEKEIPYYGIRHLIKPGLTGWAQINYHYGSSVEDAKEKLQYELYYLKNRDLIMDIGIILKTIKLFIYKL